MKFITALKMINVSIIIPSRNKNDRKNLLEENLKNIEKQKFKGGLEVIVVSDKPDVKGKFPSSPASVRNLGIGRSKGDILIFLDDDSVVQNSHYVQRVVESFKEKGVGIVAGKTLDFYSGILKFIRAGDLPEIDFNNPAGFRQVEGIPTKNAAFLRKAVIEAGKFNPDFNFLGEDLDLCLRIKKMGYKLAFNEYALV